MNYFENNFFGHSIMNTEHSNIFANLIGKSILIRKKQSPIVKPTQITLLALLSSSAYADIDYSLLSAPITVIETVNVDESQQLTEMLKFTSEDVFAKALNNNLFDDASIYKIALTDPYASATFNVVGGKVTLTTNQGSGNIEMSSSISRFNHLFKGTTRNDSSHLLKQWFDANAGLVSATTSAPSVLNPITGGGPASPVSFIPSSDAQLDMNGGLSSQFLGRSAKLKDNDKDGSLGIATRFSNFCTNQKCAQFYSLPIGYTKELGNEWALLFKLPLTYIDTAGVSSYSIALSSGLRIPISRYLHTGPFKWDLIPLFNIGGVGTDQTNINTSLLYAGGVQSNFGFMIGNGYSLVLQNQYSHFTTASTGPLLRNNQRVTYDVVNDVYRNGLQLGKQMNYQLFGRTLMASIFFADTRFSGDALAIHNQQEIGFDIGLKALTKHTPIEFAVKDAVSAAKVKNKIKSEIAGSDIKLGITYTRAKNIDDALSANLGWTF